jgi:phospholipase/lecithinase/hemolysin
MNHMEEGVMTRTTARQITTAIGLFIVALFTASAAQADDHRRIVAFGDSLSDPGNAFVLTMNVSLPPFQLIPDAPYARGGMHFSNGPTWVEQLGDALDAERSVGPALRKPLVFSNYAVGGARARVHGPFDLTTQVDLFLRDFGNNAPSDALYVVYFGSNDVRDALGQLANPTDSMATLEAAVLALQNNLLRLYAAGARHFLVPNVPDLALVPAVSMQGPMAQGAANWLASSFNSGLETVLSGLGNAGLQITRLDVFGLIDAAVAAPANYGLSNVTQPCIAVGVTVHPYCPDPDHYLFWDGIHPTRAAHAIIAWRAAVALGVSAKPEQVAALH